MTRGSLEGTSEGEPEGRPGHDEVSFGAAARLPNFVIIGAARSGTTALATFLGQHPDVFMAPQRETDYFDANYDRPLSWYAAHFAGATTERSIGEKTPGYMYDPEAIRRMAEHLPDARLIAILRNPVDRAYSHYWLRHRKGKETLSFEAAVAAEPEREAPATRHSKRAWSYLDRGRYLLQLQRVCEHYPRSSLHVVIFEHFTASTDTAYAELCAFLGIDPSFRPPELGARVGASSKPRSRRLSRAARRLPRRLRSRINEINRGKEGYPPMPPDLRRQLVERFTDDNRQLARWLQRDLSVWDS